MTTAQEYTRLGLSHILDYSSWDHLLFVAAVTIGYQRKELKKLLLLLTAFTVGHAVTLGLTVANQLFLEQKYVEFIIPITILVTGLYQFSKLNSPSKNSFWIYILTIVFGMIHGMGFADSFLTLFGSSDKILVPLTLFNLGVEIGQFIAAFVIFLLGKYLKRIFNISDKSYKAFGSGIVVTLSLVLLWMNRI